MASRIKKRLHREAEPEFRGPVGGGGGGLKKAREEAAAPATAAAAVEACGSAVLWDILAFPNVTEVTMVHSKPLRLEFLSRSAGQGRKTPAACYASEVKLLELDGLAKAEKLEQQKRRRIIEKLTKALFSFAATNDLPHSLKICLSQTQWANDLLSKLQFAEPSEAP